ncbi:MAG: polysaccharide pyruvyl transferase family protein [Sutterella wadsworthensis]
MSGETLRVFPLNRSIPKLIKRLISPETTKADIRAVRGPLTREAILKEGGKCPEIYGDPAIIMPRLYTPKIGAKHKAGLILHHTQETPTTHVLAKTCGFHQISIDRVRDEQLENFIDEVCSCQKIFSSSLHGIILAQAYGIPAQWIQITNTPIHRDANHKFADYFLGAGLPVQKPISIELTKESLSQLMQISPERVHISSDLIERLLEVFPFDIFPKK